MKRCKWCNKKNDLYITYHDTEWGVQQFDDAYLFEMLILESFQAGLSWECVLNKRENFRKSFDDFNWNIIMNYNNQKVEDLLANPGIIRNRLKVQAAIQNAKIFNQILEEYGNFISYLKRFWDGNIIYEHLLCQSPLSDAISKDLKKRGMKFVGSTIIYSYLQAIGIINSHEPDCFKAKIK